MKTLDELDRLYVAATAGEWESVLCDAPHVNDEVRMIEGPVTRANGKKFVPVISRISPTADADFIAGKCQAARYFFRWELPKIGPMLLLLESRDSTPMDMQRDWF